MKILIQQIKIADPNSPYLGNTIDILVENGIIVQMGNIAVVGDADIIDATGQTAFPAFTDVFCSIGDPGLEQKETIETASKAALAGGYTRLMMLPNTQPAIYNKAQVEYVIQKSNSLPVKILPIGAISNQCNGDSLADMYDMKQSGAVAFSDGLKPLQNNHIMLKALQYVKSFDGIIIQMPIDNSLTQHGLANEGIVSTQLGLPGMPEIAEHLSITRDIELLRYTNSKLHITGISTAHAVELIRRAKNDGLQLTCSVAPYHLHFTDSDLTSYDTNLKLNPPLRTAKDVEALKAAVLDGTVDCIATHHQPHEWDSKTCEFEYAAYGMEGLESALGAVLAACPTLDNEQIAKLFAINPTTIFALAQPKIAENEAANFCIVDTNTNYIFNKSDIKSKSTNNAFVGKQLKGKVISVLSGQHFITTK